MNNKFDFNAAKFDFWPIYETIKEYYSIGVVDEEDRGHSLCVDYAGFKKREEIIDENLLNQKNYKERWGKFVNFLKKEVNKGIRGSIYMPQPCFSGYITLKATKNEQYEYRKELHFCISLLGPYYTIYGLDTSALMLEADKWPPSSAERQYRRYEKTHVVTVSPYFEYEELFLLLSQKIEQWFPAHRMVPFKVNKMRLKGLLIEGRTSKVGANSIHHALFSSDLDFSAVTRGDEYYGYDKWLKKEIADEYARNSEILGLRKLQAESRISSDDISLHKLWKLKSYKVLPLVKEAGIGMFSFDLYKLLDLTDCQTLIYTLRDEAGVKSFDYELTDNAIIAKKAKPDVKSKLKISRLTAAELELTLYIDFSESKLRNKGDVVEMLFEQYTGNK